MSRYAGGPWSYAEWCQQEVTQPPDRKLFEQIAIELEIIMRITGRGPLKIVEVGCALGRLLEVLSAHQAGGKDKIFSSLVGIEPLPMPNEDVSVYDWGQILQADVTEDTSKMPECDISICLDVAEHVDRSKHDALFDALTKASVGIIFSAASPGYGGDGHISERPQEEWREEFRKRLFLGQMPCETPTSNLRGAATKDWCKKTITYYQRFGGKR